MNKSGEKDMTLREDSNINRENTIEVRDLAIMRNIIDISSTRGTFQGKELTLVGEIYNKLDRVLKEYEKDIEEYKKTKEQEPEQESESDTVNVDNKL